MVGFTQIVLRGVKELTDNDGLMPSIVVAPLTTDGCVDTEVNEEQALQVITSGCSLEPARGRIKQFHGRRRNQGTDFSPVSSAGSGKTPGQGGCGLRELGGYQKVSLTGGAD